MAGDFLSGQRPRVADRESPLLFLKRWAPSCLLLRSAVAFSIPRLSFLGTLDCFRAGSLCFKQELAFSSSMDTGPPMD